MDEPISQFLEGCIILLGKLIFDKRFATKWDSEKQQNEMLDMKQNWQQSYLNQNVTFRNLLSTKWLAVLSTKSMTPQQFLSRIANLKASKHVIQSGDESDSDESDHDSEVQSEPEANEDIQPAQPTSQGQRKCNYCHGVPEEWIIFQCGHPICSLCAELLNSRRRPINRKCHVYSKPIQNVISFFPCFMEQ